MSVLLKDSRLTMYKHIDGVFDEDISTEERINRYSELATNYDQDVKDEGYNAPQFAVEAIIKRYQTNRDKVAILDIAAGTGLVAIELQKHGFVVMDALEPAEGMLEEARKRKLYRNTFLCGLSKEPLRMESNTYDVITICGWHGSADPLCDALPEMIRVVKPGGVICIVTRSHYTDNLPDYKDRFLQLCDKLEKDGGWKKLEIAKSRCYTFNNEGIRLLYEVC